MFGYSTGIEDLDAASGGLVPGQVTYIAGQGEAGKTSLALNLALSVSRDNQIPVIYFGAKNSAAALTRRLISIDSGIKSRRLREGSLEIPEWEILPDAVKTLDKAKIYFMCMANMSFENVKKELLSIDGNGGFGLIVIDSLQFFDEKPGFNALRNLKSIAQEFQCHVVVTTLIGHKAEKRHDKRPILADLEETGWPIIDIADSLWFLYRESLYTRERFDAEPVEIIIAKNEEGPIGTLLANFMVNTGKFSGPTRWF